MPYPNKIVKDGTVLIDLTDSTVTPATLMLGTVAYGADGSRLVGTATGGDESSAPQGNLSITANGTYDVAQYAGASVEVPVGMTKTELKNYIQRTATFTDIDWPDGMTVIGSHAFAECQFFNPPSLPSNIWSISIYAFYDCFRLSLSSLPSGVRSLGDYAFYRCESLALTELPNVTTISNYCFYGCEKLALTSLPSTVVRIGQYAFCRCTSLTIDTLPSSVTSIEMYAFQLCSGLTSISCEGAITSLGSGAFLGNSSYHMALSSASFPNMALTSTISAVFGSSTAANACQQLAFCDIGSTMGIASNAFANCYALETLVLRKTASVCTLGSVSAFLNTPMRGYNNLTGKVYVPSALIESYKTATNWATLYNAGTVEFVAIEGSEYERD